jgi:putative FmdB family regulatory protein
MPTYVYTCDSCGTHFEKFQSFKDEPLRACPYCQQEKVRRVFQPVGIVFKGAGWYINDNRSSNATLSNTSKAADNQNETGTTETETTSEKKSDVSDTTSSSESP